MIVVDIGNSNIVFGFYNNNKILDSIRFDTKKFITNKKILQLIKKRIIKYNLSVYNKLIILGSVVPKKNNEIKKICKKLNWKLMDIKKIDISLFFKSSIESLDKLGSDRIANSIQGIKKYGNNLIIVDFGTATTFDIIKKGTYIGGVIAPGINVSNAALAKSAANLKIIEIKKINSVVGKNTLRATQSGFYWGYIYLIHGIIKKIINQKKFRPTILFTGGLASIFNIQILKNVIIDQNLTLNGLYHIGKLNDKSQ